MNLQEFVAESIVQIAKGINDANDMLADSSAMVNPVNITANTESAQAYARTRVPYAENPNSRIVEKIDFDVAVIAESGEQKGAGAKLSIASIGIGANAKMENSNKSESRIQFSIPIVYPGFDNKN